jgi:hypothetical protein
MAIRFTPGQGALGAVHAPPTKPAKATGNGPLTPEDLEDQIATLTAELAAHEHRIEALEALVTKLVRTITAIANNPANGVSNAEPVLDTTRSDTDPVLDKPSFDKTTYQSDLMRRRRAAQKTIELIPRGTAIQGPAMGAPGLRLAA